MKLLNTIKASWSSPDIRRRILVTILIIIAFRILASVPVPGIKTDVIKSFFNSPAGGSLQFLNTFAGGTLDTFSILSVGLIPFINASVIFQLLPTIIKRLENLQKDGEVGRKKITQYTRLLTVPLAILTSVTIFITLKSQGVIDITEPLKIVTVVSILTAGAVFMMWMGEVMTEKGIGNGISILIMVGILANIPQRLLTQISSTEFSGWEPKIELLIAAILSVILSLLLIYMIRSAFRLKRLYLKFPIVSLALILTTALIVFLIIPVQSTSLIQLDKIKSFGTLVEQKRSLHSVELGMVIGFAAIIIGLIVLFNEAAKNLPIYFSRKATTAAVVAKKSFMPLKVLQAGVMPIIFANALLLFPYTVAVIITKFNINVAWMKSASNSIIAFLDPPDWKYWLLNFAFTVFFAYFYTFVLFRPTQVAENLRKNGSYIPGIRPGLETEKYLTRVMLHLVFAGAMVLGIMATTQAFVGGGLNSAANNNSLISTVFTSGTSLLITVGVALDTRRQFKSYLAQRNYDSLSDELDNIDRVNIYGETVPKKLISKLSRFIPFKKKPKIV